MMWTETAIAEALEGTFVEWIDGRFIKRRVPKGFDASLPVKAEAKPEPKPEPVKATQAERDWIFVRDLNSASARIQVADIVSLVCSVCKVNRNELLSPRRAKSLVRARQIVMYVAAKTTSQSLVAIGKRLNRDHSTVFHALQMVDAKRDRFEPELSIVLDALTPKEEAA